MLHGCAWRPRSAWTGTTAREKMHANVSTKSDTLRKRTAISNLLRSETISGLAREGKGASFVEPVRPIRWLVSSKFDEKPKIYKSISRDGGLSGSNLPKIRLAMQRSSTLNTAIGKGAGQLWAAGPVKLPYTQFAVRLVVVGRLCAHPNDQRKIGLPAQAADEGVELNCADVAGALVQREDLVAQCADLVASGHGGTAAPMSGLPASTG